MKLVKYMSMCAGAMVLGVACTNDQKEKCMLSEQIRSKEDVRNLFPTSPEQIKAEKEKYVTEAKQQLEQLIAIPTDQRTFANTAQFLDEICSRSNLVVKEATFEIIQYLHPDKAMRDAAHEAIQELQEFFVDYVSNNKKLYEAFKSYAEGNARTEKLNDEQRYYLDESMKSFKRAGLDLPDDELKQVGELKKKLSKLAQEFDRAIADDQRTLHVDRQGLSGIDDSFIAALKKTDDGQYILGTDYPTYFMIMEHCSNEETRKNLYELFSNRAYPLNDDLLKQIIATRDALAKKLGYTSYGHLDLESQMVKSPERAEQFLNDLLEKAKVKEEQEMKALLANLPESVTLTADGRIKAWDFAYIKNNYKEKTFSVDERAVAEYFPMQQTIDALLDIYHQFMGVSFKEIPLAGMWHDEARFIEVYDEAGLLLGYLFLDLHPRPNKFSHAAHCGIIPAIKRVDGTRIPALSVLMANFPKAQADKPALLMRSDVKTFFHEFGHALHALFGATQMGSFAGTHTKTDFVELPSQMLEEWLSDKEILKKVSSHYQTGQPLPDEMITNILALKNYDSGHFVRRQGILALLSLGLYKEGAQKNPYEMMMALYAQLNPKVYYGPNNHFYASFGHLTGYGSKYYGYLWSKVFALDLFDTIKKTGLLNPAIGKVYVEKVIGKGGSKDPNLLLEDFLGRAPSQDAFLRDLGLNG